MRLENLPLAGSKVSQRRLITFIAGDTTNFNSSGLTAGLYYWQVAACNAQSLCSEFSSPMYFRIQAAIPVVALTATSLSQSIFDLTGQAYGSPSGNAYATTIGIYGTALDGVNQIIWSWSGATSGSSVWTKSASGTWTNAAGVARSVSVVSSTQINAVSTLISGADSWRGTTNWTVQVCSASTTSNACASQNFIVKR